MFTGAVLKSGRVATVMKGTVFAKTTWILNFPGTAKYELKVGETAQEWLRMANFSSMQPSEVSASLGTFTLTAIARSQVERSTLSTFPKFYASNNLPQTAFAAREIEATTFTTRVTGAGFAAPRFTAFTAFG